MFWRQDDIKNVKVIEIFESRALANFLSQLLRVFPNKHIFLKDEAVKKNNKKQQKKMLVLLINDENNGSLYMKSV